MARPNTDFRFGKCQVLELGLHEAHSALNPLVNKVIMLNIINTEQLFANFAPNNAHLKALRFYDNSDVGIDITVNMQNQ